MNWTRGSKHRASFGLAAFSAATLMVLLAGCSVSSQQPTASSSPSVSPSSPPVPSALVVPSPSETDGSSLQCTTPGTVEHVTFDESSQGKLGDYQVYLPPCYQSVSARRYPVVYLLHGAGHDDAYWLDVGIVGAADDAIDQGTIAPMIIVMPDGGTGFAPGRGGLTFASFLADELIPRIDSTYRTIASREGRAVGGISLGGGIALTAAAEKPTLFVAVGGHSPVVNDPAGLAASLHKSGERVWLDVGESDSLLSGSVELAKQLHALGGDVRIETPPGTHVESYWQSHLDEYLVFYNQSFGAAH